MAEHNTRKEEFCVGNYNAGVSEQLNMQQYPSPKESNFLYVEKLKFRKIEDGFRFFLVQL